MAAHPHASWNASYLIFRPFSSGITRVAPIVLGARALGSRPRAISEDLGPTEPAEARDFHRDLLQFGARACSGRRLRVGRRNARRRYGEVGDQLIEITSRAR